MNQDRTAQDDPAVAPGVQEIGKLPINTNKPAETLMSVVELIARRFRSEVCSAYLLEPDRANLVLRPRLGCAPNASALCASLCTKASRDWLRKRCGPWPWNA